RATLPDRSLSSVGRAPAWYVGGGWFETGREHQIAPVAQRQRQHAQTVPSASSNLARRTIFHALSSEAERRSHAPKVEISKFSARTSLRAKALRLAGQP